MSNIITEIQKAASAEIERHKSHIAAVEDDLDWVSLRIFFRKDRLGPVSVIFQLETKREL